MDLIAQQKVVRGFFIYEWIERPDKFEVLAEVMKLLEDKILVPYSGESLTSVDACPCMCVASVFKEGRRGGSGSGRIPGFGWRVP